MKTKSWRHAVAAASHGSKTLWSLERWAWLRSWTPPQTIGVHTRNRHSEASRCEPWQSAAWPTAVTNTMLARARCASVQSLGRHDYDFREMIFQVDLRLYQREKSRSQDELQNMKSEIMQELCMAKERLLEELASATTARMEGVETCLPQPPSEPRPRPPSPRQPGSHAVPGEVTEGVTEEVTEAAPGMEPPQGELPPNAKLASQIAPSGCYTHDKREKDKIRKSGESLQRKALALGEMCNVFSVTMYWNMVRGRMEVAMYVPGGQKIPDLGQVVGGLLLAVCPFPA